MKGNFTISSKEEKVICPKKTLCPTQMQMEN
jgi:hypothetical protein